jgi:hypothetical protein
MMEEQKEQPEQIEEIEVNPYDAGWAPFSLYKPLEYRVLFENKDEFVNIGLLNKLRDLLEQHLGEEDVDYFIQYTYSKNADHSIELYSEGVGWMVMTKLMDPDNNTLPRILRVEKRVR